MSNSVQALLRPGEIIRVSIPLTFGAVNATMFIVHFSSNKSFIEPCMRRTMRQTAKFARDNTGHKLIIVGHTDKEDTEDYNQSLSERRARSAFAYLTFGGDRKAALAEWNQLRLLKPKNELPSIKDSWGIREYQHILQDLGFYPGHVDGKHETLTSSGVKAFRCTSGLPPGEIVDDPTWEALITAYLSQDNLNVKDDRFLKNCDPEILKWLGCGERDPVKNVNTAWRPNRRVEMLFVPVNKLPCEVPPPDTFELPEKGVVNKAWCLGPGDKNKRCCFVFPALPAKDAKPDKGQFVRQPGEPGTITVEGSIKREARLKDGSTAFNDDGTIKLEPVPGGQRFFLIAPDGEIKAAENPSTGEPQPARTNEKGEFTFSDKPVGLYTLAVMEKVLVRRDTQDDAEVKGNSVCKVLLKDKNRFDVVIINAPVLREIRLPVVVHLITALHPDTHQPRPCPPSRDVPVTQATTLDGADVDKLFNGEGESFQGANFIWRQARIRFQVAEIIKEVFINPSRDQCQIDNAEIGAFLQLCTYPNVVNVFFVMSLDDRDATGDAGSAVSPEQAAAENLASGGCLVSQLFQRAFGGAVFTEPLTEVQMVEVLAHELGHFLNLQHVEKPESPKNVNRLMLPASLKGDNRLLTKDEVTLARAGRGAALECVPLKLSVTGAAQIGGKLSPEFIFVRPEGPGLTPVVVVDAVISKALIEPGVGEVTMTGGEEVTNLQRVVRTLGASTTKVEATYTPKPKGDIVKTHATIFVSIFFLTVEGKDVKKTGPNTFLAHTNINEVITIVARVSPQPFCVPENFVIWKNAKQTADPMRATVSMGKAAQTVVNATIAGQTRTVTITVLDVLSFTTNQPPFEKAITKAQLEGILNKDRTSFDIGDLFENQPDSVFRLRADVPGVAGNTIPARLTSTPGDPFNVTLTRTKDDTFVSPPLMAIPLAIPRNDVTLKSPLTAESLNIIRARAQGQLEFELLGDLAAAEKAKTKVRGRVVELCTVTIKGASPSPALNLEVANRVWAQCGVEIRVLDQSTVNRPDLLHIVNLPADSPGNPSPDEVSLFQLGRTCRSDVLGYYTKTSAIGLYGRRPIVANRTGFYQMDKATKYTFGHELGHVIGLGHVDPSIDKDNLMTDEGTQDLPQPNKVNLTAQQSKDIEFNAFVQFLE